MFLLILLSFVFLFVFFLLLLFSFVSFVCFHDVEVVAYGCFVLDIMYFYKYIFCLFVFESLRFVLLLECICIL